MSVQAPSESPGFRAFYDGLPIAVALLDARFRIIEVNTAFELAFDYAGREIAGRPFAEIVDADCAARLPLLLSRMRAGQIHQQILDCAIRSRLAQTFETRVHLSAWPAGGNGEYVAMLQRAAEPDARERLLMSQAEMFRVTIDQSPLPMSIQDNAFRFVMVNRAYSDFTGYPAAELIGRDAADFLHPTESRDTVLRQRKLVQGVAELPRFSMRRELVHRDGRRVPYRMEIGRSRGLDGEPLWVAVLIDLTRQEQAEAQQKALLECVSAGLAHVVDGVIVQVNPALLALTGRAAHDLQDRPASALFTDPTTWPAVEAQLSGRSAEGGELLRRRAELRTDSGDGRRRCEIVVRQVDPERPERGRLLTVTDIGELLEQSDRLRASLTELESLLETEPVGIVHLDQGRIVRANRAMRMLLDRPEDELLGRPFESFCRLERGEPHALFGAPHDRVATAPPSPGDAVTRAELRASSGRRISCLLHASAVGARPEERVVVAVDLSQQMAALDFATRMQVRFDNFAALVDQAVAIVDLGTDRISHANHATRHVLGVDPAVSSGQPSARLWGGLAASDRRHAQRVLAQLGTRQSAELTVERDDGGAPRTLRVRFYGSERASEVFVLAEDITDQLLEQQQRLADAVAQRETLVREVHHRIKNNLQGVAGLLEQTALDEPALLGPVRKLAAKIQTIAQVHGLQIRPGQVIATSRLVEAVAASLRRTMDLPIRYSAEMHGDEPRIHPLGVRESDSISIALMVNELVTNACKHRQGDAPVDIRLVDDGRSVTVHILNQGALPEGADPLAAPSVSRGMGLVAALLPRRGASLQVVNTDDDHVLARLVLTEPLLVEASVASDA